MPAAGVVTSWSYQAPPVIADVPQVKLKVARRISGIPNDFMIVGEGTLMTPIAGVVNTYPAQIPVAAGDLIGVRIVSPGGISRPCARSSAPGFAFHSTGPDPPPGAIFSDSDGASPNLQLDLAVSLETTRCTGRPPTIAGTPRGDKLRGTPGRDVIVGLGGNDTILGLGGNDLICGGGAKDRLFGGKGKDRLIGGGGRRDTCVGGKDRDKEASCESTKSL